MQFLGKDFHFKEHFFEGFFVRANVTVDKIVR